MATVETPPAAEIAPELQERWTLSPADRVLLANKAGPTRVGFALQLKFFQAEGRFPAERAEIPREAAAYVAAQVEVDPAEWERYDAGSRAGMYHRRQIRDALGFRPLRAENAPRLVEWLTPRVGAERSVDQLALQLHRHCRDLRVEPPSPERTRRLARSALFRYEQALFERIHSRLLPATCARLDALLESPAASDETPPEPAAENSGRALLNTLRADAGRPSVKSVQDELAKLERIRSLELPPDLFRDILPQEVELYRQRVAVEAPFELRRHPEAARLSWLAAYVFLRGRQITDTLVDLLIDTIHHIGAWAERRVERELLEDLKRVSGKQNLLFQIADAALEHPDACVRDVVFPIVNEATLRALVKEWKATGPAYRTTLRTVIRNSYRSHYRQMVPHLVEALDFRSNNDAHRPVVEALELLKRYARTRVHYYPPEEEVPIDGVVRGLWREAVEETDSRGEVRINRITYEICTLEALREQLRCKEIWVDGADRYRNPEQDLPQDFYTRREDYYAALELPTAADPFLESLEQEMDAALRLLDAGLARNRYVRLKANGQIVVSPLAAQPEPLNLAALKAEIADEYPMTGLLDMLKEADLRLGFSDAFRSPTTYEGLDRRTLQARLLLCLHGMGTNAGLKRMHASQADISYKDLLPTRRRYINADRLREAIATVVNGTLHARQAEVWGEGTTACASDSKHFGAWDQNLMTKWHVLARPHWRGRLEAEDLRALSPLIWGHVNPYGTYQLDLDSRIPLD